MLFASLRSTIDALVLSLATNRRTAVPTAVCRAHSVVRSRRRSQAVYRGKVGGNGSRRGLVICLGHIQAMGRRL